MHAETEGMAPIAAPPRRARPGFPVVMAALGLIVATVAPAASAQSSPPPHPESDTVPSFNESVGCGPLNGIRGPQMGPGPYDSGYPYHALPDDAELHGPWADFFGRTIGDVRDDLVVVHLPGLTKDLYIHQRALPAFELVLENLAEQAANGNVYEIRSDTWSFNPATIPPGRHLSFHGAGTAIDVNSSTNPYRSDNVLVTDMPEWFVDAWRDAGWCWGGDWVTIKDPMHFAWMGPTHTPGYGPDPAPYPADTTASSFVDQQDVSAALGVTTPARGNVAIDVDRDGAPDIVRFRQSYQTGAFRLEAAEAWRRFDTCTSTQWAPSPSIAPDAIALGDYDSDARPELWLFDETGATLQLAAYSLIEQVGGSSAFTGTPQLVEQRTLSIPTSSGATYAVGDHDRDGDADLYVIRPGTPTRLEVWQGPALDTAIVAVDLALDSDADWRFDIGDMDLDGVSDLYALSPDGPATLATISGGTGFSSAPVSMTAGVSPEADETMSVEDYDGDGRDDLYLVGADGGVRVILGGVRAADADLDGWFVKEDLTWTYGTGCTGPAMLRATTNPPVPSQILVDGTPFNTWGLTWVKLPPGTFEVSFTDVEGFSTPPAQTVTLTEGSTTTVTGTFSRRGFLRATTDPPLPATVSIEGVPRNDWGVWTDLDPGDHEICFGPVPDYSAPDCQTVTVTEGATTEVTGVYTPSDGAAGPSEFGMLRVTTDPALPSRIIVDGTVRDTWGLNWLKLDPGEYTVSFSDVAGYETPEQQTITVVEGETTTVAGEFTEQGWLRVSTEPAVPGTVMIDGTPRDDWGMWTDLGSGDYEVCFGAVAGYIAPSCVTTALPPGTTTVLSGEYG